MDRWLGDLLGLLRGDDPELRRSAARVLGALRPPDPEAAEALGAALSSDDRSLRALSLEALGAIGAGHAFAEVAALLADEGDLGRRAVEVLTAIGPDVLPLLRRRFGNANATERRRILAVAVQLGGAGGIDLLLRALEAGHAAEVLELGVRRPAALASVGPKDRATLVRRVDALLAANGLAAEAAGAAVDLVARVLGREAAGRLIAWARPPRPPSVRRRALEALARTAGEDGLAADEATALLGFLRDRDYGNVVAPAMKVLETTRLSAAHAGPLLGFLSGDDPALRRFAVAALGQVDSTKSASALLAVLGGDNPDLQDRAAESLKRQTAAVPLAADALAEAADAQTAWALARILQPHDHRLKPDAVKRILQAAVRWLEAGDPRGEAAVTVLRDRHLDALAEAGLQRARRLKRERRAAEVLNLLRPLQRDGRELPVEIRYEVAIAELVRGRKDVVREARLENAGLQALEPLVHDDGFPLLARLKREKSVLTPEEYYLVGSHFAERPFADRTLGGEILRWLVRTFPEDSSALAASNKLLMEGFAPPPKPPSSEPPPRRAKPPAKKQKR
jgi:hypothetical protein